MLNEQYIYLTNILMEIRLHILAYSLSKRILTHKGVKYHLYICRETEGNVYLNTDLDRCLQESGD